MKMVEFVGLSGPIKFDASGLRTQFVLSLMELQMPGLVSINHGVVVGAVSEWEFGYGLGLVGMVHCKKRSHLSLPRRDVTYQTPPGRE